MNTPEQAITLHQKAINDRDIEAYVKNSCISIHLSEL
jgi:hypothetical protein